MTHAGPRSWKQPLRDALAKLLTIAAGSSPAAKFERFLAFLGSLHLSSEVVRQVVRTALPVINLCSGSPGKLRKVQRLLQAPELDVHADGAAALCGALETLHARWVVGEYLLRHGRVGRQGCKRLR